MENNLLNDLKEILKAKNVKVVERLIGGMSNYTYVVNADDVLYTFRVPGEYSENFVDRVIEKENIKIIEKLNITNETVYLNVEDGKKIAKYVNGKPLSLLDEYPYDMVADILKVIHTSNLKAVNDYQPFARLKKYEDIIIDLGYVHPEEYLILKEKFNQYKTYLENTPKVLTHGDSQPSNFVLSEDQLMVVDFEFCANNDPLYDIACFANKKYEEGLKLLNVYYKNPSDDQILRFHLWRCFQCLQWYNVATFKELKGMSLTLHIDFKKVAVHYLDLVRFLIDKITKLNKNI